MDEQNGLVTTNLSEQVEKSLEVFKQAPGILISHQTRAQKAVDVGKKIEEQWKAAYAIEDIEKRNIALAVADERSNKFLVNCRTTNVELKQIRSGITQLMDSFKDMFTSEENKLDSKIGTVPALVQKRRNEYSTWIINEKARIEKEEKAKADKKMEAVEVRLKVTGHIAQWLLNLITARKTDVQKKFNEITLENYEKRSAALENMECEFPKEKLTEFVMPGISYYHHNSTEINVIKESCKTDYDYNSFFAEYERQLSDLKQSLVDQLPSKKAELDEQEAMRLKAIKDQEELQEKLKQEKNKQEQERLKKEAEANAQKLIDEQARLERDKKQREDEAQKKIDDEAKQQKQNNESKQEVTKAAAHAETLYEHAAATSFITAPSAKSGFEITVLNVMGWIELIQFWYENEGINIREQVDLEELDKKTFKQVKSYAEKQAKDKGTLIESRFLRYEKVHKAMNRKQVEKKESA